MYNNKTTHINVETYLHVQEDVVLCTYVCVWHALYMYARVWFLQHSLYVSLSVSGTVLVAFSISAGICTYVPRHTCIRVCMSGAVHISKYMYMYTRLFACGGCGTSEGPKFFSCEDSSPAPLYCLHCFVGNSARTAGKETNAVSRLSLASVTFLPSRGRPTAAPTPLSCGACAKCCPTPTNSKAVCGHAAWSCDAAWTCGLVLRCGKDLRSNQ